MDKLLYSKREAAETLGISIRSVENLISSKQLVSRRVGRRRMIPFAALVQLSRRDTPRITGRAIPAVPHAE